MSYKNFITKLFNVNPSDLLKVTDTGGKDGSNIKALSTQTLEFPPRFLTESLFYHFVAVPVDFSGDM